MQLAVTGRCRRKRLDAQHAAIAVDRRRDMHIHMRIDSARDRARGLYDGHRHPFCSKRFKGWHARPGKETVPSTLREQRTRSPSGTGRALSQARSPVDMHPANLSASNESDRPTNHAERSDHHHTDGGPTN